MAEVRRRGDTYQISVFLGRDSTGRKIYQRTTYIPEATTEKAIEKEVDLFANSFEKRVKDGDYYDGDKITFSEFVEIWKENFLSQKSRRVQESYSGFLNRYFIPKLGTMKISKIRAPHIDSILHDMKKRGLSAKTIHNAFTPINSVMKYAFKKALITENPCIRCDDLPSIKRSTELHYFTVEQSKTFLNALTLKYAESRDPVVRHLKDGSSYNVGGYTMHNEIPFQWRAYFSIAIYGGFRKQEIVALTWEDIDFDNETIDIDKAIGKAFGEQYVKETKTTAGVRTIRLPSETFRLLREWKLREKELCLKMGTAWTGYRGTDFDRNYVFIDLRSGQRMNIDTPSHKFREICDMYNSQYAKTEDERLPHIRLHDLRHTSATLLLSNGTDIETVSRRLGHSKASITLDIYAHATQEADETASQTLEKIFCLA